MCCIKQKNQLTVAEVVLAHKINEARQLLLSEDLTSRVIDEIAQGYEKSTGQSVRWPRIWARLAGMEIPD